MLARLPDAPPGSKGISLFVVPKFLPNADGSLGERNPIFCTALEHKMGIHGNATARSTSTAPSAGWSASRNKGLAAMFVMMNAARLGVGNQSLGLTEVAYQNAVAYAKDRIQMRSLSGPKAPDKPADPIIVHPDVRKMLLTARAYAEGGRALSMHIALLIDNDLATDDDDERKDADDEVALLTPIVKAFLTDNGWIATSHCMQVFGGHGYIREWGMEQFVRDARINMIYEGTNTIQSLDLLGRKVLGDNGAKLRKFGKLDRRLRRGRRRRRSDAGVRQPAGRPGRQGHQADHRARHEGLRQRRRGGRRRGRLPARAAATWCSPTSWPAWPRWRWQKKDAGDPFYTAKLATARFYFAKLLPETAGLIRSARAGLAPLMAMDEALF